VEDALITQQHGSEIGDAIKAFNQATMSAYRPNGANSHAQALVYAEVMEVDRAARMQWVLGRLIVELTRHRVRGGIVTADRLAEEENQRIVAIAQQTGKKFG
jgi:hypothetical protein